MCLSAEAFALFLNVFLLENLTTEPGHIVIHAEVRDAHWILVEDRWCTDAPQVDRLARITPKK